MINKLPVGVGQDWEIELELASELDMRRDWVRAHAEDVHAIEMREFITELTGLNRSPRGVVLGIEKQDRFVTLKIAKRNGLPMLILQRKIRKPRPFRNHPAYFTANQKMKVLRAEG